MAVTSVYLVATDSIDEPPNAANAFGAPDGTYCGNTNGSYYEDIVWRASFDRPLLGPTNADVHTVTVYLRKNASGGNDPTLQISASSTNGGAAISVYPTTTITDGVTEVSFNINEVDISSLQQWDALTFTMLRGGGGPSSRRQIEIDAVKIDFNSVDAYTSAWANSFDGGSGVITTGNSSGTGSTLEVTGSGSTSAQTYSTSAAAVGTHGLRHVPQGNTSALVYRPVGDQERVAVRCYLRSTSTSGAYTALASIRVARTSGGTQNPRVTLYPGANWATGPGNALETQPGAINANVWYCVDQYYDGATSLYKSRVTEADTGTIVGTYSTTITDAIGVQVVQISYPFDGGFTTDTDEFIADWTATDLLPALPTGPATHTATVSLAATADLAAVTPPDPILRRNTFEDNVSNDPTVAQGTTISGGNSDDSPSNDAFTIVAGTSVYDAGNLDGSSVLGYRSAQSDTGTAGTYNVFGYRESGHGFTRAAMSAWVNWAGPATTGTGANESIFLSVRDSSDTLVAVLQWETDTGQIRLRDGAAGYTTLATVAASSSWYRFDLFADWSSGSETLKARVVDEAGAIVGEVDDPTPNLSGFTLEAWDLRAGHQDSNPDGTVVNFDDLRVGYGVDDFLDVPRPAPVQVALGSYGSLNGGIYYTYPADDIGTITGAFAATYTPALGGNVSEAVRISYAYPASEETGTQRIQIYRDSDNALLGQSELTTNTGAWGDYVGVDIPLTTSITGSETIRVETVDPSINLSGPISFYLNDPAGNPSTVAASASGSLVADAAVTRAGSGSAAASGSLVTVAAVTRSTSGSAAVSGSLVAEAAIAQPVSGSLSVSAGLSAEAGVVKAGSTVLPAAGDLVAVAEVIGGGAASLPAAGDLVAEATVTRVGSPSFPAVGDLVAEAAVTRSGSVSLTASGSLAATGNVGTPPVTAAAALAASGSLVAEATVSDSGSSSLQASGDLVAAAEVTRSDSSSFPASGSLVAAAEVVRAAGASFTAAADLTATAVAGSGVNGSLSASAGLSAGANVIRSAQVSGALNGAMTVTASGASLHVGSVTAAASAEMLVEAEAVRLSDAAGSIAGSLQGSASVGRALEGSLSASAGLSAEAGIVRVGEVTGALSGAVAVSSSYIGATTATLTAAAALSPTASHSYGVRPTTSPADVGDTAYSFTPAQTPRTPAGSTSPASGKTYPLDTGTTDY